MDATNLSTWQMIVRPMRADDIAAVSALLRASWYDAYIGILSSHRIETTLAAIAHGMTNVPRGHEPYTLATTMTNDVIGLTSSRHLAFGRQVRIDTLYIRPDYQGRGVGTVLIEEAQSIAEPGSRISIEVLPANTKAITFYRSRGFAITRHSFNLSTRERTLIMTKTAARPVL